MPPRLAILTGGGDCPGLNAVIRAAAKTAILEHGAEIIGIEDGFEGLIHDRCRALDYLSVSGILTEGGTILGTSNRADPFKYGVQQTDGSFKFQDVSAQAVRVFKSLNADVLIVIGGDGTLSIASGLCKLGVPCVGVPKTIDNDLYGTDQTFGFDTAMSIATEAVDRLHTTAQAHHRVMIVEVMGRNAGWLALGSGLAGGGDIILLPEIPYRLDAIVRYIEERRVAGKKFSLVVVAEGAKPLGGDVTVMRTVADAAEPRRLGGIGNKLRDEIEEATGQETRVTILGHLQRGGTPTPFDRVLASRLGREASALALKGRQGIMVGLRGTEIVPVDLAEIAGKQRLVEKGNHLLQTARSVGTCFGDGE
jgi:6-phosphofructokinase 1